MPLTGQNAVTGNYPQIYSTLLTTTIQSYRTTLVDVISDSIPAWWWFNQSERKKYQQGGESILQPLMHKLNPVQRFSGLDKLDTTTKEGISPDVFLWKHYHTSVVIPMIHLKHNVGKAKILDDTLGFVKIVTDKRYDEVVGVHVIGPHATELIAEAATALELEATAESIFHAFHAHPTLAEAMGEAALAAHGRAIHI